MSEMILNVLVKHTLGSNLSDSKSFSKLVLCIMGQFFKPLSPDSCGPGSLQISLVLN